MKLGDNILKLIKDCKLSQEQLAEKIDVTRQTISNWELGETSPNPEQLKLLSKALNVSIDELLNNDIKQVLVEKVNNTEKLALELDDPFRTVLTQTAGKYLQGPSTVTQLLYIPPLGELHAAIETDHDTVWQTKFGHLCCVIAMGQTGQWVIRSAHLNRLRISRPGDLPMTAATIQYYNDPKKQTPTLLFPNEGNPRHKTDLRMLAFPAFPAPYTT